MAVVEVAAGAAATTGTYIHPTMTPARRMPTLAMRSTRFATLTQMIPTSCLGEVDGMCTPPTAERAPRRRRLITTRRPVSLWTP